MKESFKITKDRKRAKIVNSAFTAFLIPFIAGAILSFGAQISESFRTAGIIAMIIASGMFIWGIIRSAQDSIRTEERISYLEEQVKKLEKGE